MLDAIASQFYTARLEVLELVLLGFSTTLLFVLESIPALRARRATAHRARHAGRNLGLWAISLVVTTVLLGSALVPMTLWLESRRVGLFYHVPMPVLGMIAAGIVVLDAADYLLHRLSHEARWLWRLHSVHHSDPQVDVTTNVRAHPLHVLCTLAFRLLTLAALGFPQWIAVMRDIVAIPVALWSHANVAFPPRLDRVLRRVLVTPAMHRVHHSPWQPETDSNYGGLFSIWDRLFGTYREPRPAGPVRFGLDTVPEPGVSRLWGLLCAPWRMTFEPPAR
ncbi:MAG: sterol desaturase family protein [Proteobacteria bacterium]|nr:sterol desaturase family protein [Pseudomonadota bacterium]